MTALRIGTRGSKLALIQADFVARLLRSAHPGLVVDRIIISTEGDRDQTSSLASGSNVGWFTSALQGALQRGEIDIAVHSYKDLPTKRPDGLVIAAVPSREDPRDAWVSRGNLSLAALPAGAVVGSSSVRRVAQLSVLRPDLNYRPIRGNVDTRLAHVASGAFDATVLALAGLKRLGLEGRVSHVFGPEEMLPAPAQGALAVECRTEDTSTRASLSAIHDPQIASVVEAERSFLAALEGGCASPSAAHCILEDGRLHLTALIADDRGLRRTRRSGTPEEAAEMGRDAARELLTAI